VSIARSATTVLQEPVHRHGPGELVPQQLADSPLRFGERERQAGVEGVEQTSGPPRAYGRRYPGRRQPPPDQRQLRDERLVEAQPVPAPLVVAGISRPVDQVIGLVQTR
jgi:hypothetical protein